MNPVEHNPAIHPVEPEEVMALHDGELEPADAARVEAHIRECAECQKVSKEMKETSVHLASWSTGACPEAVGLTVAAIRSGVLAALPSNEMRRPQHRVRNWTWGVATAAVLTLLVFWPLSSMKPAAPSIDRATVAENAAMLPSSERAAPAPLDGKTQTAVAQSQFPVTGDNANNFNRAPETESSGWRATLPGGKLLQNSGPMVIRTVGLEIVAEDYAKVRASLDRILVTHNGFAAQLSATDSKGSAQALTATLRVPADKLASAVAELKKLGRVENETHTGEEVTQQYTDLNARLSNARNTEQRLIAVLQQRTGKVRDILEVEQEIARVREEIERMDAQRRTMENQVQLATIQLQIREDYKAALHVTPPSTGTRLWNSLVAGITSAANTVVAFAMFALEAGPTLLLWAAVLFLPARFAWRRLRPMWNMPNLG